MNNTVEKKDKELDCLKRVIELGLKQRGRTKKFARTLNQALQKGDIASREAPDFVVSVFGKSQQLDDIIGIEHFRVDHMVEKKRRKAGIVSTGVQIRNNVINFYNQNKDIVLSSDVIPDKVFENLCELMSEHLKHIQAATYPNFIESFTYGFNKHIRHIDAYRNTLQNLSRGFCRQHFGFLIEIHTEFSKLLLSKNGKITTVQDGTMPMFEDIVHFLEEHINYHKVDFIVFYLSEVLSTKNDRIVYVTCNNIRHSLEKQNIPIYEYAGDDRSLLPFRSHFDAPPPLELEIDREKETFSLSATPSQPTDSDMLSHLFSACKRVLDFSTTGKPYATTQSVQMIADMLHGLVYDWRPSVLSSEKWKVYPLMTSAAITEFLRRWDVLQQSLSSVQGDENV